MRSPDSTWTPVKVVIALVLLGLGIFMAHRILGSMSAGERRSMPTRPCWKIQDLDQREQIEQLTPVATLTASDLENNSSFQVTPDPSRYLVGKDRTIKLLETRGVHTLWTAKVNPRARIHSRVFSPSGDYLAATVGIGYGSSVEFSLHVIDSEDGSTLKIIPRVGGRGVAIKFLSDQIIYAWQPLSGQSPRYFQWREGRELNPDQAPPELRLNPPPVKLTPPDRDRRHGRHNYLLENLETGKTLILGCGNECRTELAPDYSKLIAYGISPYADSPKGRVEVIDLHAMKVITQYQVDRDGSYLLSPDASLLLVYDSRWRNFYKFYNAMTGKELRGGSLDLGKVEYFNFSPDGRLLIAPFSDQGVSGVKLIDVDTMKVVAQTQSPYWDAKGASFLTGHRVGFVSFGEYVIVDYQTGKETARLGKDLGVRWAKQAPDGGLVGLCDQAGEDRELRCLRAEKTCWDLDAGLSPDGKQVAIAMWNCQPRRSVMDVINVSDNQSRRIMSEDQNTEMMNALPYHQLVWADDDKVYFISAATWTLAVWDPADDSLIKYLSDNGGNDFGLGGRSRIRYFGVSNDGRTLVSTNGMDYAIWDRDSLTLETCVSALGRDLRSMAFDPRGRFLVLGYFQTADFVDLRDHTVFARIQTDLINPSDHNRTMSFSHDGSKFMIATGSRVLIYDTPAPPPPAPRPRPVLPLPEPTEISPEPTREPLPAPSPPIRGKPASRPVPSPTATPYPNPEVSPAEPSFIITDDNSQPAPVMGPRH